MGTVRIQGPSSIKPYRERICQKWLEPAGFHIGVGFHAEAY